MVTSFVGFVYDHPETDGPLAIAPGETFDRSHAVVRRYGSYHFCDSRLPSWDQAQSEDSP
jgi:hypothetical protein